MWQSQLACRNSRRIGCEHLSRALSFLYKLSGMSSICKALDIHPAGPSSGSLEACACSYSQVGLMQVQSHWAVQWDQGQPGQFRETLSQYKKWEKGWPWGSMVDYLSSAWKVLNSVYTSAAKPQEKKNLWIPSHCPLFCFFCFCPQHLNWHERFHS